MKGNLNTYSFFSSLKLNYKKRDKYRNRTVKIKNKY